MDLVAAPQLPDENAPPEAFAGKGEALISPFFKAIARDLDGPLAQAALDVKDLTKRRYARTKLRQLFALTDSQFEGVLRDAGAEVTWRPLIEEYGGFKFDKVNCPSSAALLRVAEAPAAMAAQPQGAKIEQRENTLSKELGKEMCGRITVPELIYALLELSDPRLQEVDERHMGYVTQAALVWLFCKSGKWNVGAYLLSLLAYQLSCRAPNLRPCNGKPRSWLKALTTKANAFSRTKSDVCCQGRTQMRCVAVPFNPDPSPHLTARGDSSMCALSSRSTRSTCALERSSVPTSTRG